MANGFTFAGRHSRDFALVVEKRPAQSGPVRKRTAINIPGRNGALHIDENAYENYLVPYECHFRAGSGTPDQAHQIKAWLQSPGGYQRLEDEYDPQYFRLAMFAGPLDVENLFNKYGKCTITFDCAPQSFLKSGEIPIAYESAGELYNPTMETALPVITVYGTGPGEVSVGGVTVEIKEIEDQITLDCDLQQAYRQVADSGPENYNGKIYAPQFPALKPGLNGISFTGGITKVEIIPRWWTL